MRANFKKPTTDDPEADRLAVAVQEALQRVDQPQALRVTTARGEHRLGADTDVLLADPSGGSFRVILPAAVTGTAPFVLKRTGASSNVVTVHPASPDTTIDGAATLTLTDRAQLVASGGHWHVVG